MAETPSGKPLSVQQYDNTTALIWLIGGFRQAGPLGCQFMSYAFLLELRHGLSCIPAGRIGKIRRVCNVGKTRAQGKCNQMGEGTMATY